MGLQSLHDFGGRKYVIAGIGAVGCCPSQRNQNKNDECHEEENQMALKYNEGLKSMLKGLKSELKGDMNYSYVDVYAIFDSFIRTPSNFGTSTQFFSLFNDLPLTLSSSCIY